MNVAKQRRPGVPISSQSSAGGRCDRCWCEGESVTVKTVARCPAAGEIVGTCGCGGDTGSVNRADPLGECVDGADSALRGHGDVWRVFEQRTAGGIEDQPLEGRTADCAHGDAGTPERVVCVSVDNCAGQRDRSVDQRASQRCRDRCCKQAADIREHYIRAERWALGHLRAAGRRLAPSERCLGLPQPGAQRRRPARQREQLRIGKQAVRDVLTRGAQPLAGLISGLWREPAARDVDSVVADPPEPDAVEVRDRPSVGAPPRAISRGSEPHRGRDRAVTDRPVDADPCLLAHSQVEADLGPVPTREPAASQGDPARRQRFVHRADRARVPDRAAHGARRRNRTTRATDRRRRTTRAAREQRVYARAAQTYEHERDPVTPATSSRASTAPPRSAPTTPPAQAAETVR